MEQRIFTCPYCATAAESTEELKRHVVAEHHSEPLPSPDGLITLTINGQNYEVRVEPHWTLYQVIQDYMQKVQQKQKLLLMRF